MSRPVLLGLAGAGLFIAALDAYVVVTLLPAMVGDVGLTIEHFERATPIVTGFLAGYVVAMPLLGAYSDVRGRVPVYAVCMAGFAVGSAMTATAGLWDFAGLPWLVAGRFIQGVGGGGLVPLSLALAADLYRDRARAYALGSVAAVQEAGSVFGPLYGAALAAAAAGAGGWRFAFWLNLPLAAICTAGLTAGTRRSELPSGAASSSIDWLSAALLGVGVFSLLERPTVPFPLDGKHRDKGLGRTPRPLSTELYGVLFCDYNIIPSGGDPHEPLEVFPAIGVMVLIRHELHACAGRPELRREAFRISDACGRGHPPPSQHFELLPPSGPHALEMRNREPRRADRRPRRPPSATPTQPVGQGPRRVHRRASPGHDDQVGPAQGIPALAPRARRQWPRRT